MNISILKTNNFQKTQTTFGAGKKIPNIILKDALPNDVIEISAPKLLPKKMELTEKESFLEALFMKARILSRNADSQKDNWRHSHLVEDKLEYQSLLRQRNNADAQVRRFAKKEGSEFDSLATSIEAKRGYNRYAPKVYRASTEQELDEVKKLISESKLSANARLLLVTLIEQKRSLL